MTVRDDRPQGIVKDEEDQGDLVVLIVGDVTAWTADGRSLPDASQLTFAEIDEITPGFIHELNPDIVLSSIFTPKFDALDLARALGAAGFTGRYRALTPRLPNPGLVRREVRSISSEIDFDVLVIDQTSGLRPN